VSLILHPFPLLPHREGCSVRRKGRREATWLYTVTSCLCKCRHSWPLPVAFSRIFVCLKIQREISAFCLPVPLILCEACAFEIEKIVLHLLFAYLEEEKEEEEKSFSEEKKKKRREEEEEEKKKRRNAD